MLRPSALLIAGAAVLATAGVAHAQDRTAPAAPVATEAPSDSSAALPWYQRFTSSSGVAESIAGESAPSISPTWSLNQRWGLTLDVREANRIELLPENRGDQTSVGAFYQFTPNMRVGGQLSVETPSLTESEIRPDPQNDEPRADVRIESAFRF
jgi:hypothetical protein